jgi:hypothetical protein
MVMSDGAADQDPHPVLQFMENPKAVDTRDVGGQMSRAEMKFLPRLFR